MKANTVVHGLATGAVGLNAFDGRPTLPLPHDGMCWFQYLQVHQGFKYINSLYLVQGIQSFIQSRVI